MKTWLMWVVQILVVFLLALGSVAFITLMERKVLGLSQIRLGPNKVTLFGLLQPVFDGVKLLLKYLMLPLTGQLMLISLSPVLMLVLFLLAWTLLISWEGQVISVKLPSMLFFILLSAGAYSVILMGWSSASAFSKLGSLRGMLQSLSFEVVLIMGFLLAMGVLKSLLISNQYDVLLDLMFFWMTFWLILSLMEGNRAPFDLLEGESELISGFNIEMGSITFVYLFLSEYGMIMVMAAMGLMLLFKLSIGMALVAFVLLLVRSCYPRVRYDSLMEMMWQGVLPLITILFFVVFFI